jgi:hypothetical protein
LTSIENFKQGLKVKRHALEKVEKPMDDWLLGYANKVKKQELQIFAALVGIS